METKVKQRLNNLQLTKMPLRFKHKAFHPQIWLLVGLQGRKKSENKCTNTLIARCPGVEALEDIRFA